MAAGLGFKEFTTGDVLTAADANGYLASQVVMVFASSAARTSAIASPQEGMISYLKDTNSTEYYSGSAWAPISAGGGGKVLQVVQGSSTTLTASTSTSLVDTTLTATITPSLNTSKILILASHASTAMTRTSGGYANAGFALLRGATVIQDLSNSSFGVGDTTGGVYLRGYVGISYLDSPATTSATTYKTQMKVDVGTITAQYQASPSQIILLEIGA